MNAAEQARSRLQLLPLADLVPYEERDELAVGAVAYSLHRDGVLNDPIVVDARTGMIIDGHHRSRALLWLGRTNVPAFVADYASAEIEVRSWHWRVPAPASEVHDVLRGLEREEASAQWCVTVSEDGESHGFSSSLAAAEALRECLTMLRARGAHARPVTEVVREKDSASARVGPVIGKTEILQQAGRRRLFPPQVNRHLVNGRPLNLRVPLEAMADETAFDEAVLRSLSTFRVEPRAVVGRRVYDERVVIGEGS